MSEDGKILPPPVTYDRNESVFTLDGARDEQQQPCSRRYDIAVLCVVIAVVCVLLSLPTIFYHLPKSSTDSSTDICIPENYTGNVCRKALSLQQSGLPDGNATVNIITAMDPASSQQDKEQQVLECLPSLNLSVECMEAVVPLLCFYIFPLCDGSGRQYQPSSAQCSAVTDDGICAQDQLPQCQLLPQATLECNATDLAGRVCSEGFYIDESTGLCIPECGVWEEFPHSFVVGFDTAVILSAVINLIFSIVVLVLSCISYKRMFSFPSVFIVYNVIALGVVEVLVLIGYTDRTSLYCSSRDLFKSIENETPFCTLHGLAFNYASITLLMFWFFYIALLFWKIMFPIHAKDFKTKGHFRYICIIMVITAIFFPLENVAAVLGTGGLTIPRFPPVQCFPRDPDATFYSFVLPASLLFAIAVSLIAIILWVVTKVGNPERPHKLSVKSGSANQKFLKNTLSATEVKALIVFFYFFSFGVYSLTFFTIITSKDFTNYASELTAYFACESQGVQPGRTCERNFDRMGDEIAIMVTYILLGFYPLVNLPYVVSVDDVKAFLKALNPNGRNAKESIKI